MLFSIVTVTYNAAPLLERTIESVLGQAFPDSEYIIIDGGSNDGTLEIISNYSHRLKYWISEKDSGIYNAMNKAIQQCSGEWVIFMNAGDTFSSNDILARIQPHCTGDTDIIYGDRFRISTTGEKTYQKAGRLEDSHLREVIFHQSCLIRTNLLKERPYDESYKLAADYEFILHSINEHRKFKYTGIAISNFLEGGASSKSYLLSHIEAIHASITHTKEAPSIHQNFFFNALAMRHLRDVMEHHIQDSKNSNPDFGLSIIRTARSVNIYAKNTTPALAHLLNQINRGLSFAPTLLPPDSQATPPFATPTSLQTILDQNKSNTATDNINLVQAILALQLQVNNYKEENQLLLTQLNLTQQQLSTLTPKTSSIKNQARPNRIASKIKSTLRKHLSERNILRLHKAKSALLRFINKAKTAAKK